MCASSRPTDGALGLDVTDGPLLLEVTDGLLGLLKITNPITTTPSAATTNELRFLSAGSPCMALSTKGPALACSSCCRAAASLLCSRAPSASRSCNYLGAALHARSDQLKSLKQPLR